MRWHRPEDSTRLNRRRRSIRLHRYDYTRPGAYFVTICANERRSIFGAVRNGSMVLSEAGRIAEGCWLAIPEHFPNVSLDAFVIMPDHLHGIIVLRGARDRGDGGNAREAIQVGARHAVPPQNRDSIHPRFGQPIARSLPTIIGSFKSAVTNRLQRLGIRRPWQRNYYERVVRNRGALDAIRWYIRTNPVRSASRQSKRRNLDTP